MSTYFKKTDISNIKLDKALTLRAGDTLDVVVVDDKGRARAFTLTAPRSSSRASSPQLNVGRALVNASYAITNGHFPNGGKTLSHADKKAVAQKALKKYNKLSVREQSLLTDKFTAHLYIVKEAAGSV